MLKFSKFVAVVLAIATIGSFVPAAQAQTTAELQAQIQSLLAMIAQLQAQLAGGSSTGGAHTYSVDLTIGSKGADVTALQQFLVSKGFLTMPAGASFGFFGSLTKSALAAYQASAGITPAAGYFGPKTRAVLNAIPAGSPSASGTPSVSSGPLTGGEGIMTVEENGTPAESVKVYEGDVDASVFGFKVKAQNSDLRVERVKVQIGTSVTAYTKQIKSLSLWDGSTMLQKLDLSASNVTKESNVYYVYFNGLNSVVSKDQTKVYTIKADIYSTVETGYKDVNITLSLPTNAVRAKDAAGLDQYGPTSAAIDHIFVIKDSLSESASLSIAKSGNSPKDSPVVSNNTGDVSEATVLAFDLKATDGLVKIDQLNVAFTGDANETTAYLYDGSTLLQSATVSSNSATFTDLEDTFQVPADTTKTFTLKVDYSSATTTASTSIASIYSATNNKFLAYNSDGSDVAETGSATSSTIYVSSVAPLVTLQSSSIKWNDLENVTTTDTLSGQLVLNVKAEGGDVYIPETGAFDVSLGTSTASASTSTVTVSYQEPTGVTDGTTSDKIAEGTTVTYTVDVVATAARITASGSGFYLFFVKNINWSTDDAAANRVVTYLSDQLKTTTQYAPSQT